MSEMKLNTTDSCTFDDLRKMVNELDDGVILSLSNNKTAPPGSFPAARF